MSCESRHAEDNSGLGRGLLRSLPTSRMMMMMVIGWELALYYYLGAGEHMEIGLVYYSAIFWRVSFGLSILSRVVVTCLI